jgi:hypothetical protein
MQRRWYQSMGSSVGIAFSVPRCSEYDAERPVRLENEGRPSEQSSPNLLPPSGTVSSTGRSAAKSSRRFKQ